MNRALSAILLGLAAIGGSAAAQTEVMPFGAGAMLQPPNGPAIMLSPSEMGTVLQTSGGPPMALPTAGPGTTIMTTPSAPPTMLKPFGSSTVIETPGQPAGDAPRSRGASPAIS
jgi:hypothetical protein